MSRIVVDPVTRIEGHLRIETEVVDGSVQNAWSSGTLFRGVELILKDRNPEDAWLFTQRLCGVCTYVHGSTSVRCVEDALNLKVPANARIIRNLAAMDVSAQFVDFVFTNRIDNSDDQPLVDATRNAGNVYYGINFEKLSQTAATKFASPPAGSRQHASCSG